MNTPTRPRSRHGHRISLVLAGLLAAPLIAFGAATDLSDTPLSGASSAQIKPNVVFIMDDSYSMSWEYLPDWAGSIKFPTAPNASTQLPFLFWKFTNNTYYPPIHQSSNASFNGIAYNPAITYLPPSYFDASGAADTATYPSQTGTVTDSWKKVPADGYGIQKYSDAQLENVSLAPGGAAERAYAYYFTTVPGEFCTDRTMRDCSATPKFCKDETLADCSAAPKFCKDETLADCSATRDEDAGYTVPAYTVPAYLRWCKDAANAIAAAPAANSCQAAMIEKDSAAVHYMYPRMPAPRIGRITVGSGSATTVSSIKVDGKEILSGVATGTTNALLATDIRKKIMACAYDRIGQCETVGYRAELNGTVEVRIFAPDNTSVTPSITRTTGTMAVTGYAFAVGNAVPGYVKLIPITDTVSGRVYPKADSRKDCTEKADSCSYTEEMENYANWFVYYRTRMQAMKTAASRSFKPIDDRYRIGYYSINNNTSVDFQNVGDFSAQQKFDWYRKLFEATPFRADKAIAETPLRRSLSDIGRLYAGEWNGKKLNGVDVVDPMQYYCQPNVTILSTDGYWNTGCPSNNPNCVNKDSGGFKLGGGATVSHQDSRGTLEPPRNEEIKRPQLDGGAGVRQKITERYQKRYDPQDRSWFQDMVEQWQEHKYQLVLKEKKQDLQTNGYLVYRQPRWYETEWKLQKVDRVYREWWHYYTTPTLYDQYTTPLNKEEGTAQAFRKQLQKRTFSQPKKKTGPLQWKQKSWYQKRTRELYQQVVKIRKTTTNSITGDVSSDDVDECTTSGTVSCALATPAAPWVKATSTCTTRPYGSQGVTQDGNTVTVWTSGMNCQYRYSADLPEVPDSAVEPTDTCHAEGSSGSPYEKLKEVRCADLSSGTTWNTVEPGGTCTESATITCQYAWGDPVNVNPGECSDNYSTGPIYTITDGTSCLTDWSDPEDVETGTCVVDANTACSYREVGWVEEANCVVEQGLAADGKTFTVIKPTTECAVRNKVFTPNVTDCTHNTTGVNRVTCSWGTEVRTATEMDKTSCENSASGSQTTTFTPGSAYTGPRVSCVSRNGGAVAGEGSSCPSNPEVTNCTNHSGWHETARSNPGSCTPVPEPNSPPQYGDTKTECSYVPTPGKTGATWTHTTCTETTPNDPASLPAGTYTMGTITKCGKLWDGADWKLAEGTCTKDKSDDTNTSPGLMDCSYDWARENPPTKPVASCTEVAVSSAPDFTELRPVLCDKGFDTGTNVDVCPDPLPSVGATCGPVDQGWQDITDPAFLAPPEPLDKAKYQKRTIRGWMTCSQGSYSATGNATPCTNLALPTATRDTPAPNNKGYCAEDKDYSQNLGAGIVLSCKGLKPNASAYFYDVFCKDEDANQANGYVKTICGTPNPVRSNPVPDPNCGLVGGVFVDVIEPVASNSYVRTICSPGDGVATPDTLADVAEYYWKTDLRTPDLGNCSGSPVTTADGSEVTNDVCAANTGATGPGAWHGQYMRTFTLGLGASGVMQYQLDYDREDVDSSDYFKGDYYSILTGRAAVPDNGICSWQAYGSGCNWPKPDPNKQTNIDDLWHAAVNGRGKYFSAQNPEEVASSITAALASVTVKEGGLSEPVISDPNLAKGDVHGFVSSFTVESWTGSLQMFPVNPDTGKAGATAWTSSIPGLATRTIHTFDKDASGKLKPFAWANLTATEQAYFKKAHIEVTEGGLSQFCSVGTICLAESLKNDANFGKKLVDFLRGDQSNEGPANVTDKLFRQRSGLLGDIVHSTAAYVQKPVWLYTDNGYSQYRQDKANRAARVYVGANDGMLHAFDAADGKEAWAYVPKFLMPVLFRLADKLYSSRHRFYVDGSPVSGDICIADCAPGGASPVWKTILVGGANAGGRGYYALDVTDPDAPKGLWEFSSANDANLGFTYGNPVITKLGGIGSDAGKWVVIFASGYNNADGQGRLFVLDAHTGQEVIAGGIATGAGSPSDPSGLAKIAGWASNVTYNNTVQQVYGGDLLGNVWRFDVNDMFAPDGHEAHLLATLKDGAGKAQPITSPPELASIKMKPVVFIGTGQLLGNTDLETKDTHSFYAIKDPLDATTYSDIRDSGDFVGQTMTAGLCPDNHAMCEPGTPIVTVTKNPVSWATDSGWYVDFPVDGERVNTTTRLVRGTLSITTNKPETGACVPAGISYKYFLDYQTGGYVGDGNDGGYAGGKLGDFLSTGGPSGQTSDGKPVEVGRGDASGAGSVDTREIPTGSPAANMRRISWRELVVE
jgi:type IV pilus assembly protein PilY1